MDIQSQPNGRDDLQDAGGKQPAGDQVKQRHLSDIRPKKGQDRRDDAHGPFQEKSPPRSRCRPAARRGRNQGEHPIEQGVTGKRVDHHEPEDSRPEEDQAAENDGQDAS